jgi:16S rRNA (guanine966-N2)-methyltransferase
MRIIAGAKRGMKLFSPPTDASRPFTDRVKESLFSVLYKYDMPEGKIVADLFCGVGSLGLESLSRGAKFVTFVERNAKIAATLCRNIEKAGFIERSKVIKADAFKIGAPVAGQQYDLVFVDPPYSDTRQTDQNSPLAKLLDTLAGQTDPKALIVIRTHKSTALPNRSGCFAVLERRRWGTMAVNILGRDSV